MLGTSTVKTLLETTKVLTETLETKLINVNLKKPPKQLSLAMCNR